MCELDLNAARSLQLKRSNRYRLTSRPKNRGEHFDFVEAPDLSVGTIQCGPLYGISDITKPIAQDLGYLAIPQLLRHWTEPSDIANQERHR